MYFIISIKNLYTNGMFVWYMWQLMLTFMVAETILHFLSPLWMLRKDFSPVKILNVAFSPFGDFKNSATRRGFWGGWGCEVSCGGHHRPRGKTTTGSALDGAVFDIAQILAYLVHNILSDSLLFTVDNILWLNYISSVEITLFLLADILLQHRALFQC